MEAYVKQNKLAWEHNTYNFWVRQNGPPEERAKLDLKDPQAMIKKYMKYFGDVADTSIAVVCGSCGKKAVPLAILGAAVTVFDLSEENARYGMETALAAGVNLDYVVGNILDISMWSYGGFFDIVFMEGGILGYFHDLRKFMNIMHSLLKHGGRLICSDFHPLNKAVDILGVRKPREEMADDTEHDYFSTDIEECEMPHARFYEEPIRSAYPKMRVRRWTLSEILNAAIGAGFFITGFDEHPAWQNERFPGEFTLLAEK